MGRPNFSDEFKRDAVAHITHRSHSQMNRLQQANAIRAHSRHKTEL